MVEGLFWSVSSLCWSWMCRCIYKQGSGLWSTQLKVQDSIFHNVKESEIVCLTCVITDSNALNTKWYLAVQNTWWEHIACLDSQRLGSSSLWIIHPAAAKIYSITEPKFRQPRIEIKTSLILQEFCKTATRIQIQFISCILSTDMETTVISKNTNSKAEYSFCAAALTCTADDNSDTFRQT